MQGLSLGFCGGFYSTVEMPYYTGTENSVELDWFGFVDDLYITTDMTQVGVNHDWNYNTALLAEFNNTTVAGNTAFTLATVSELLLKKRKLGEFTWHTINRKDITKLEDFTISGKDYLSKFEQTYEYAVVGALNGVEGNYQTKSIESSGDWFYVIDADNAYGTYAEQGACDTTRNTSGAYVELPKQKYYAMTRNSILNCDSGSMSGLYVKFNDSTCMFETAGLQSYRREIIDFLANGKAKLLKLPDGRMWLISVDAKSITTAKDTHNDFVRISFNWTEIGDCESDKALYYAGLLDMTSTYWVN